MLNLTTAKLQCNCRNNVSYLIIIKWEIKREYGYAAEKVMCSFLDESLDYWRRTNDGEDEDAK